MYQANYPPLIPKLPSSVRRSITVNMTRYHMSEKQAKLYLCKSQYFCTLEQLEAKLSEKPPSDKDASRNRSRHRVKEETCACGVTEKLVTRLEKRMCRSCAALVNGKRNPDPTAEKISEECEAIRAKWGNARLKAATGTTIRKYVETPVCDFGVLSGSGYRE